ARDGLLDNCGSGSGVRGWLPDTSPAGQIGMAEGGCPAGRDRTVKIAVVGTGYVGLVQGTCLAESGNDVVCVDKVAAKIEGLRRGRMAIYEPGLGELVHRNLRDGRLAFTTDLAEGLAEAEIVFIAVGTPQGAEGGADLGGVWEVGRQIASKLHSPKIIVIK